MINLNQPLPAYLTTRQNIIRLVIFTALFALIFINIYSPFGVETWYNVTRFELFVYSSLVILTGVLVVVVSRILLYYFSKRYQLSVFQYILWIIGEVLFMSAFYAIYEKIFLHDYRPIDLIISHSVQNTALVLFLPYSALWLYFSYVEKKKEIEAYHESQLPVADGRNPMISFADEKGVMRLSLKLNDLLYIEASSNYVWIGYEKKGKLSRFLLRNTMKKLEADVSYYGIVRCHRSFMVNTEKVKLMRKDRTGLTLEMDCLESVEIPVSKSNVDSLLKIFSQHARQ